MFFIEFLHSYSHYNNILDVFHFFFEDMGTPFI